MYAAQLASHPSHPRSIFAANIPVQAEVSLLWTLVDLIPPRSSAGDDNREAIEAQLSVLVDELNLAQVLAEFYNESTDDYVLTAAIKAAVWLEEGGESPSTAWLRVVHSREAA
jgi:hypothetical protein